MAKRLLFLLFLVIPSLLLEAQDVTTLLEKGDKLFFKKKYSAAAEVYEQAYEVDPENPDVNFKLGLAYLDLNLRIKSLPLLEKAYRLKPEVDEDVDYHLGMAYSGNHIFDKAIMHFEEFARRNKKLSDIARHKIERCVMADSIMKLPSYSVIENFAAPNSPFHEYSPILFPDGQTMVFTSNRSDNEYQIKSGTNFEDIYILKRNDNGWGAPQKISENINTKYHDAAASLSPDGKTLYLYYEEGAGDIFTSTLVDETWTKPLPLNKNVNTPMFWETSASLSPDGKRLFFTSNRPGGKGELDIYVSDQDAAGNWQKAVNLGGVINTPGNEDSPFLHPDGTLYFSSDGHPGLGSNDIFKSKFIDGKWTRPVNLGYPVNSIDYDGFFSMSPDNKTGYFSTLRDGGSGEADIYQVRFLDPPAPVAESLIASVDTAIPPPVETQYEVVEEIVDPIIQMHKDLKVATVLKGKVIDEQTNQPLGALISLVDNQTNITITKINSNPVTGDFELIIPHGGNYGVATDRSGYLFNSINFNVPQFAEYQEIDMSIIMVKAELGKKIILKNIFFDVGKAEIKSESIAELDKLFHMLFINEVLKVQINGHTDNTGNAASNKILSLHRAEAVVTYLKNKGISSTRLIAMGFGSERPLVSNDDEDEGRAINRRTEIEIIGDH
jgi:outer membrane protein OmpA-like peptidoglycan-associated protein/tetratricopeptide (TPR) repeat protein